MGSNLFDPSSSPLQAQLGMVLVFRTMRKERVAGELFQSPDYTRLRRRGCGRQEMCAPHPGFSAGGHVPQGHCRAGLERAVPGLLAYRSRAVKQVTKFQLVPCMPCSGLEGGGRLHGTDPDDLGRK